MVGKKWPIVVAAILTLLGSGYGSAFGMVPYETYVYDYEGEYAVSPDAYVPDRVLDARDMGIVSGNLQQPADLVAGEDGDIYIADTGNNRIVVLDGRFRLRREITRFVRADTGETDGFNSPAGLFFSGEGLLYVADSKNARIVVLRPDGELVRILEAPDSDVLPAGFVYEPTALGVDPAGRIYVISKSTNMGVIALNADGQFDGFVGAEKVAPKVLDLFWRLITTKEQKLRSAKNVPTEYNNITIDEIGFAYVTSSAIDARNQYNALRNRDKSSQYAPVKRLNNMGVDVLKREGAFPPAGDLVSSGRVSRFIDVALAGHGIYSTLDSTRQKIFTYDEDGNLLYVFGGYGSQKGVFRSASALAYRGSSLLVLDRDTAKLTVFRRTEYGDNIAEAIRLRKERKYNESIEAWRKVLKQNPNFEMAYAGVAQSNMRQGEYREAMKHYKLASDWENYFKAFAEYRKEVVGRIILLIPFAAVLAIWLAVRFFRYAARVNASGWRKSGRRTLWEELLYAFHVMVHPFDGFWDLKHERRGSVRAAVLIVLAVMGADIFRTLAGGYVLNPTDWRAVELADTVLTVLVPFVLWCCANWGLTTLMDGEGSLKDIFVASAYSLMPIVVISVPATVFSNALVQQEAQFLAFFSALAYGWALLLIFVGVMVTNDYTPFKNLYTSVISVVGMGFIAFLSVLFMNIMQRMNAFIATVIQEITFRL